MESAREFRPVVALYVTKSGAYYGLEGVDPWDEERDARLYDGPYPVVAHPPCARWSRLAGFTEARFGYKQGEDGGCFEAALRSVRTFGGVLEHPAYSKAWDRFGLPKPMTYHGWTQSLDDAGASCYVEQGRYGLPVKKATWLYAFAVELPDLRWGYTPDGEGDDVGGVDAWRDRWAAHRRDQVRYASGPRDRRTHMGQTITTPEEFRDVLIATARSAYDRRGSFQRRWEQAIEPDHFEGNIGANIAGGRYVTKSGERSVNGGTGTRLTVLLTAGRSRGVLARLLRRRKLGGFLSWC